MGRIKIISVIIKGVGVRLKTRKSHNHFTILYQDSETEWLKYEVATSCLKNCVGICECETKDLIMKGDLSLFCMTKNNEIIPIC